MKKIISTDQAPGAVGPYSQAVQSGSFLFVSGTLPVDPVTGAFAGDTIETQARQVMENLKAVIQAAGLSMASVVKCSCFLKDMNDFTAFNGVYAGYFTADPPARECVQVARLPKDALVEVSAVCSAD
ncbi:MAG: RidA family protein [Spirochaetales bacterium]|nr:RidA family protein [Spirochaetales bacterium]